jgi:Holliday junction resolvasome RuvABC ATP-dependent DNA helicase subunit
MRLAEYVGQDHVTKLLTREIAEARRKDALYRFDHVLLTGPGGLGKSTLAKCIATEISGTFLHISDPKMMTSARIVDFLMRLPVDGYTKQGQPITGKVRPNVVFIDEAHRAAGLVESLYDPLQDFQLTINGTPSWLPFFTFIAATTDPDKLPASFKDRFPLRYELRHYATDELATMICDRLPGYDRGLASEVAQRSRRNARLALSYAGRVVVHGLEYFDHVGIDENGCTALEQEYLTVLGASHRPMSLSSIANRLQQKTTVIAGEVEPYLLALGLINIGPEGRTVCNPGRGARG